MQVSLDYYRILGVPLQGDSLLIEQAYNDRLLQLPHQNYSPCAIASRQGLLQQAYYVLRDDETRLKYESTFFAENVEGEEDSDLLIETTIDIEETLFIGALLVLLDLGDYELVLSLLEPYLSQELSLNSLTEKEEDISLVWQDLVLTGVLTYVELAKEQWQDKQYDLAANCLESAEILLNKDGIVFSELKHKIKQDLVKLRPYQILELLTKEENNHFDRERALHLIQEMLDSRGGMENKNRDNITLNIDTFLKFIEEVRVHLTAEEQYKLFELEAKRPSPAALYLSTHACIGKGFSYRQPDLILKAKKNLVALTIHQDVYLEQSICALLLGQTAEIEFSLNQSKEKNVLDYIIQKSQNSPDLLPGLCDYAEKWLETEIFPQFKDLQGKNPSIEAYFENENVQKFLENISPPLTFSPQDFSLSMDDLSLEESVQNELLSSPKIEVNQGEETENLEVSSANFTVSTEEVEKAINQEKTAGNGVSLLVRDANYETEDLIGFEDFLDAEMEEESSSSPVKNISDSSSTLLKTNKDTSFTSFFFNKNNIIISVILLIILSAIASWAVRMLLAQSNKSGLMVSLSEAVIELPPPETETVTKNLQNQLNEETAKEIINKWLEAKKQATGSNYNITGLNQILTPPLVGLWVANSNDLRRRNAFRRYEHEVNIESVEINPQNSTEGVIKAVVREKSQYYQNSALIPSQSYEEKLLVQYDLVKEGNKWLITKVTVLGKR